ncbi:menaquinone biosynthetic enzyme MqnA/MqnD family protein [Desulfococcus sp.]|uniref:menaquinone biosynthetic enzyme MqnA/MqnD family protein n=1 Tax=Desulfococcus sp. TaxID=2025834 RepID=UPI0035947A36
MTFPIDEYPAEAAFRPAAPVRVGRISYMNVAPVYYGLNNGRKPDWIDIISAPPAALNAMMDEGRIDISPVSSAAYARHQDDWLVLPDLSIACLGPVMSVLLVSRHPFEDLNGKKVILTRDSATAAALTRCLLSSAGVHARLATGRVRTAADLPEDTGAALVIGDAALREAWSARFDHVWDLGELWRDRTGLPFVFALWAVRRSFAEAHPACVSAVLTALHRSRREGMRNIGRILPQASDRLGIPEARCREYYSRLRYSLDPAEIEGLSAFFRGLCREKILSRPVRLSFFRRPDAACAGSHAA